jgi:hypothetical protein
MSLHIQQIQQIQQIHEPAHTADTACQRTYILPHLPYVPLRARMLIASEGARGAERETEREGGREGGKDGEGGTEGGRDREGGMGSSGRRSRRSRRCSTMHSYNPYASQLYVSLSLLSPTFACSMHLYHLPVPVKTLRTQCSTPPHPPFLHLASPPSGREQTPWLTSIHA